LCSVSSTASLLVVVVVVELTVKINNVFCSRYKSVFLCTVEVVVFCKCVFREAGSEDNDSAGEFAGRYYKH